MVKWQILAFRHSEVKLAGNTLKKLVDLLYCPGEFVRVLIRIKLLLLPELPGSSVPLSLF